MVFCTPGQLRHGFLGQVLHEKKGIAKEIRGRRPIAVGKAGNHPSSVECRLLLLKT